MSDLVYAWLHEWPISTRILMPIYLIGWLAILVLMSFGLIVPGKQPGDIIVYGSCGAFILNLALAGIFDV